MRGLALQGWIVAGLLVSSVAACSGAGAPEATAPAATAPTAAAPGAPRGAARGHRELDADARLREVRASGAPLDDAWTARARTLFERWRAGTNPALLAGATLEASQCFRLGCVTRMVFPSREAADAMSLDFFGSEANTGTRDTVFRSPPADVPGSAAVAIHWAILRTP